MSKLRELTKEQKVSVLQKVISGMELQKPEYNTFCIPILKAYREVLNEENIKVSVSNVFKVIPELLKYKPEELYKEVFWFPINAEGLFNRIQVLKCTVEDIKKQK